jgi:predicted kinase
MKQEESGGWRGYNRLFMDQPFFILITGHSCTGKSTLRKELQKYLPGTYHIGYDSIKWNLSGYSREKDVETVRNILYGFLWVLFEKKISCISDMFFSDRERYEKVREIAIKNGYIIIPVELRCSEDIRIKRFGERVNRAKMEWSERISVTDEGVFRENMRKPFYFPEDSLVFDTSQVWVEEITERILWELKYKKDHLDLNFEVGNTS